MRLEPCGYQPDWIIVYSCISICQCFDANFFKWVLCVCGWGKLRRSAYRGLKSLREIEQAQKSKQKRLYHLGVKSPVSRSALSRMNLVDAP